MIAEFDEDVGLADLLAVHANDSKRPCGAGVDRHENIGEGFIGQGGFAAIMGNPAFHEVPFLLEVPGFDGKGPVPACSPQKSGITINGDRLGVSRGIFVFLVVILDFIEKIVNEKPRM